MRPSPEPVLGWRLWRLRGRELASWGASYMWKPNRNVAGCLKPNQPCAASPGQGCKCGFWALYSPERCFSLAREDHGERAPVLGLMRAWGEIALHGAEGFRAQYAAPVCVFTDWIWDAHDHMGPESQLGRCWRTLRRYMPGADSLAAGPLPDREKRIREAADDYVIPALSLADALRLGALQELGVSTHGVV